MPRLPRAALACLALALGGAFVTACGDDEKADERAEPAVTEAGGEAPASEPVVVRMKSNKNMPEAVDVKVGQKLVWRNQDGYAHTVTSTAGEKIDSGNFTDSFDYTPKRVGTIDYICTIHTGQNGKITVTK